MLTGLIIANAMNQRINGKLTALLPFAQGTLIQYQIQEMNKLCSEIIVVTGEPGSFYPHVDISVRLITEFFPSGGILSSMHAGFSLAQHQDIWVVGSNMPFLSASAAELMWERKEKGIEAVVPVIGETIYPLHGIFDRSCASSASDMLEKGDDSVEGFLKSILWQPFSSEAMKADGIHFKFLYQIQSKEDYDTAVHQKSSRGILRQISGNPLIPYNEIRR